MGLSLRERRALAAIAGRLQTDEPELAHSLSSFAAGAITMETLPSRRHMLAVALLAVLMAVMAVALPALGAAGHRPAAATQAQYGG
ncbi:DUF3040 domain-containing protein [Planobispora siamensis]|uniref:DUF3040 domain-containing protein n=1 Tax=Planobispora siamensis TaxID=936338 RepID=A0A8J3SRF0_9ACTN|nr:DUF3040 domain-containing protein [Planobispora siamensis]GIH97964.1 hypothetical protein Psi01_85940 [Planobispora siamensis]